MANDTDQILSLCQYQQVRAELGVLSIELPNEHILNSTVEVDLELDLLSWLPTDIEVADIIADAARVNPDPDDVRVYKALVAYSSSFCALSFIRLGALRFLKSVGDGGNTSSRQSNIDYQDLEAMLLAKMDKFRAFILKALGETITSSTFNLLGVVPRSYDPVTGEET